MANFTIRVELHKASSDDYENLHTYMEAAKFGRKISKDGKDSFLLPTAEYSKVIKDLTTLEILEQAKTAATKTKKECSILVTKSDEVREWYNLSKVHH